MAYEQIKLIVQFFEQPNFQGQRFDLSEGLNDMSVVGFSPQSVRILRGPSWSTGDVGLRVALLGGILTPPDIVSPPSVTLELTVGFYPLVLDQIRALPNAANFGIIGISINNLDIALPPDSLDFPRVPIVVELYEQANFQGRKRILYRDEKDLQAGTGFGNIVSSLKVFAGPNFVSGLGCKLFQQVDFGGGMLSFGPGDEVRRLEGFSNDEISSAQIRVDLRANRPNPPPP